MSIINCVSIHDSDEDHWKNSALLSSLTPSQTLDMSSHMVKRNIMGFKE